MFNLDIPTLNAAQSIHAEAAPDVSEANTGEVGNEERTRKHTDTSSVQQESTSPDFKTRNECLSLLKNINSGTYMVQSETVLSSLHHQLSSVDDWLSLNIPKMDNLPIRTKSKKSKKMPKRKTIKHSSNITLCEGTNETMLHKDVSKETTDVFEDVLSDIWSLPEPTGRRLGTIGPYTLYDSSLICLQSRLSDEVMDAMFFILAKKHNVEHISCVILTAIMKDQSSTHSLMKTVDLYKTHMFIGAVNEDGNHWTLIVLKPQTREMVYFNSLGEKDISSQRMLVHWYSFLRRRQLAKLDEEDIGNWKVVTMQHSHQLDSVSCGIYVIKFAEQFLEKKPLHVSQKDVPRHRKELAISLLSHIDCNGETDEQTGQGDVSVKEQFATTECQIEEKCQSKVEDCKKDILRKYRPVRKRSSFVYQSLVKKKQKKERFCVCAKPDNGQIYWQCETCTEWYHPECIGHEMDDEPDQFQCTSCTTKIQLTDLPDYVLETIFIEVVLSVGDMAYQILSLVSKPVRAIVRRRSFQKKCHLAWIQTVKPKSFWLKNMDHFRPFDLLTCHSCNVVFKEENCLYVGGHGKRGEFSAVYDSPSHPGYCNRFCMMVDQ